MGVARGPSLGATFMVPDEGQSMNKAQVLAQIDVGMGGHVAEKLVCGNSKITSGCSSDLQGCTNLAQQAVRNWGMFGDRISYSSTEKNNCSDAYNAEVDRVVKEILDESFTRV